MKEFLSRSRHYIRESLKLSAKREAGQSFVKMLSLFPQWNRSLNTTPVQEKLPWLSYAAIDFLNSSLSQNMRVFEWGVGGSTLFFAERVREIISVEHDPEWAKEIQEAMRPLDHPSWQLHVVQPTKLENLCTNAADPDSYASASDTCVGLSFKEYASIIDRVPTRDFDFVLVDGRCRPSCARHAISKIKPGGCLIFDDADRQRYAWIHREMKTLAWEAVNVTGPGPCFWEFHQTACWRRPI